MHKPLHRIDLNLLVIFQILLQERSVTLTAKWLSISPSAVSKALAKLRVWFDDPLFVRSPQGLIPTPLTLSIEHSLSDFINISYHIVGKRNTEIPKGLKFNLVMESPLHQIILPDFLQKILSHFPESTINMKNWEYNSLSNIIDGEVDIGLVGREYYPRSKELLDLLPDAIDYEILFKDTPLVYLHKDHPLLKEVWNLDNFLNYSHVSTVLDKRSHWALDDVLSEHGRMRNIALTYTTFEQSLFMVAQSGHQLITSAPGYCLHYIQKTLPSLTSRPIPLPKKKLEQLDLPFILLWHKRNSYNTKTLWLRETIKNNIEQFIQKNVD
ncbi:HTH-type transcriptional regulator YidZ [Proteus vulgaris]|uniref:HTH-type transcriptional regulator YidZ n=1 Tax=Proteus vulgaris TaxID=585 RepID=UPI0018E45AAC|nr:HTH-type transcriptional regulator YidZ [Proteus vulgaris]MBI6527931.1 HTH-type transcriptional regulator YidZ [Proteus vulgaris]